MHKPTVFLGAVAIVTTATAIYFHQELLDEREHGAELQARIAQLESRRPTMRPRSMDPVPAEPAATATENKPKTIEANARENGGRPDFERNRQPNNALARLNDPAARDAMRTQQKMRLLRMYPDLAASLRLRPEEVDKFFDLLTNQQMKSMELRESLRAKELPRQEFANELRQATANQNAEQDKQIAALLGDDKLREWKDYEKSLNARIQVRELSTILEGSGMPLRADQSQSLVDALVAEQNRYTAEQQAVTAQNGNIAINDPAQRLALFEQNLARQEQHIQRSHDALSPYLTAEQLKRYDEINNQQLENQRMNLERMRQRAAEGFPVRPERR